MTEETKKYIKNWLKKADEDFKTVGPKNLSDFGVDACYPVVVKHKK